MIPRRDVVSISMCPGHEGATKAGRFSRLPKSRALVLVQFSVLFAGLAGRRVRKGELRTTGITAYLMVNPKFPKILG